MSDQATLDAMARQQGFPDYATMAAWQRHRSEALRQSTTTTGQPAPANNALPQAQPPANQLSWYQRLFQALGGGH